MLREERLAAQRAALAEDEAVERLQQQDNRHQVAHRHCLLRERRQQGSGEQAGRAHAVVARLRLRQHLLPAYRHIAVW